MAKKSTTYLCSDCGWSGPQWYGRCPNCGHWGTIEEFHEAKLPSPSARRRSTLAGRSAGAQTASNGRFAGSTVAIPEHPSIHAEPVTQGRAASAEQRLATGFSEFDRVLGGGIVPGSVTLVAGEPGIGKSTLLLQTASNIAAAGNKVLYVSGEESTGQIRLRARRIGASSPNLLLASTTDLGTALALIEENNPALAIVDSVQTIQDEDNDGISGGTAQVREVARGVIDVAKSLDVPVLLVGHVTKDGSIAGPRTLEHLVDVVCQFEGDTTTDLRLLRAVKNRFGATDEVGCFDMSDEGIEQVTDPTGLFVSSADAPSEGTCVTLTMEGQRALPIEIQSLATASVLPAPRRATNGVDYNRVAMLVAVLYRHAGVRLLDKDLYISTIAGASAREPGCDLAICVAMASAAGSCAIPRTTAALGEVSLTGEIRAVPRLENRLAEAARLGFTKVLIPAHERLRHPERFTDLEIRRVGTLSQALRALGITAGSRSRSGSRDGSGQTDFGDDDSSSSAFGRSAGPHSARYGRRNGRGLFRRERLETWAGRGRSDAGDRAGSGSSSGFVPGSGSRFDEDGQRIFGGGGFSDEE